MGRLTDEEMQARIDAALSGYERQEAGIGPDPGGASVDSDVVEAIGEIDSPISAVGDEWRVVAMAAWWALTGRGEPLPEWFDDWTTIGEMARRLGRGRAEVRAALDLAKAQAVRSACRCPSCADGESRQRYGAQVRLASIGSLCSVNRPPVPRPGDARIARITEGIREAIARAAGQLDGGAPAAFVPDELGEWLPADGQE